MAEPPADPYAGFKEYQAIAMPEQAEPLRITVGSTAQPSADPYAGFQEYKGSDDTVQQDPAAPYHNDIRDYLRIQREAAKSGLESMQSGLSEFGQGSKMKPIKAAAQLGLGAAEYAFSPVNALIESTVGRPLEARTGIPKDYTDLAVSMALPIPKRLPMGIPKTVKSVPTTEKLFEAADTGYEAARASNITYTPQSVKTLADKIEQELTAEGYRARNAPKTFDALKEFDTKKPSNFSDIESVRKVLQKAAKDPAESDAARRAIAHVDDTLSSVPAAKEARANYAAGKRSGQFNKVIEDSKIAPNPEQYLKNRFRAIVRSPKLSRGFSDDELDQMRAVIAAGGKIEKVGAAGGAIPVVGGFISKPAEKLAGFLTNRQVQKLDEMIRARSPLAEGSKNSLQAWSNTRDAFHGAPIPRNFARFSIASRNLSNNLKDLGIIVSPDDLLMRSIQGPVKSAADQEQ